jgi:hypothetical protein
LDDWYAWFSLGCCKSTSKRKRPDRRTLDEDADRGEVPCSPPGSCQTRSPYATGSVGALTRIKCASPRHQPRFGWYRSWALSGVRTFSTLRRIASARLGCTSLSAVGVGAPSAPFDDRGARFRPRCRGREFRAELSEKSQESLKHDYESACVDSSMIVFIRDNIQRRLVSYIMSADGVPRPPDEVIE